jgi:hypothetical protein
VPSGLQLAGWSDCPPPHLSNSGYVGPLDADRLHLSRAKRARETWHAILAGLLLDNDGGGTANGMVGALGYFKLRLTAQEVDDLLDSARRAVKPVISTPDSPIGQRPIVGQVLLTDAAAEKRLPKRPSARSLSQASATASILIWKVFDAVQKPVLLGFGLFGIGSAVVSGWALNRPEIFGAGVALVLLAMVLFQSARIELDRKAAALVWPRLKIYRRSIYDWETHSWRHWTVPLAQWLIAALGIVGFLTTGTIRYAGFGLALVLFVSLLVTYAVVIRPLSSKRIAQIRQVETCRAARGWYGPKNKKVAQEAEAERIGGVGPHFKSST